jgi:hypothetical protein
VLSASALLGAPTLDASAAAAAVEPPRLSTSTSTAATTTTTTPSATYRLPVVSPDPAVLSVQRVLLQAWDIVDGAFVDGSFGGRGQGPWRGDLVDSLDAAAGAGAGIWLSRPITWLRERATIIEIAGCVATVMANLFS